VLELKLGKHNRSEIDAVHVTLCKTPLRKSNQHVLILFANVEPASSHSNLHSLFSLYVILVLSVSVFREEVLKEVAPENPQIFLTSFIRLGLH
jgi:hypothetical protein